MKNLLLVLALVPLFLFAQSRKERKALEAQQKADLVIVTNLKNHIQNLSDRTIGSNPEAKAAEYISSQFKLMGLQPKGTNGFIESYSIDEGKKIAPSTYLKINSKLLEVNKEYYPLPYSAEKKVTGTPAMALRERGVPWFVDLKDWLEGDAKVQQSNMHEAIKKEIARAASKGATALFLYNSSAVSDNIAYNGKEKSTASAIPVMYITQEGYKKYFNDHSAMLEVDLNIAFKDGTINGANVAGLLNNAAPSTVVIAISYGVFEDGLLNSSTGSKANEQVDDNSSSIALFIELAKMLSASKAKSNNYLFVAFGGADGGAVASNYWLEKSGNTLPINYMINLDLPGGLTDNKKVLVQGVNSSPVWADVLATIADKKIEVTIDSATNMPNHSAVFYKKGIPELLFSFAPKVQLTGADEAKVNFAGEVQIAKMIRRLVEATDTKGKIAFSKIPEQPLPVANIAQQPGTTANKNNETSVTAATVSLGVIPDKTTSEAGLKIIGVSQKKLASKLGLQAGDVLTELGAYKISDLKSYMEALSNFKTGDKTTLRIKRGKDDKEFAVEF